MLAGLLSRSLFGVDYRPENGADYGEIWRESLYQSVPLTAFSGPATEALPPEVCAYIKPRLRRYMMQNSLLFAEHAYLDRVLTEAGIPYCIIKGVASAAYYPEPYLRGMGDVDFYVEAVDLPRAEAALVAGGFTLRESDSPYHIAMEHHGIPFEMHHELPGVPMKTGKDDDLRQAVRALRADLLPKARRSEDPAMACMLPDPFHHGLILLLHTQQHLLTEGIGLRHLSDWAVFVGSMSSEAFEEIFRERLSAVGLWRFACLFSLAASRLLGLPHRAWMGTSAGDEQIADALLDDLWAGGNFGAKDPERERVYEAMLLANRNKGRRSGGRFRNGMASLNTWVHGRWPAAAKCPLLLPFGWVYFVLRRAVLVLTGKKQRISLTKAMQGSRDRQRVYDALRLFEPEK